MSHVKMCGLVLPKRDVQRYGIKPIIPQTAAKIVNKILISIDR